jgi:hypothetical protein
VPVRSLLCGLLGALLACGSHSVGSRDAGLAAGGNNAPVASADAGSTGAAAANAVDAGTGSEGSDGGPVASANSCDGVVPATMSLPFSVDLSVAPDSAPSCRFARPDDGEGTIPLRRTEPESAVRWSFYDSSTGAVRWSVRSRAGEIPFILGLTQPQGFAGFTAGQLWTYAHDGRAVTRTPVPVRPDVFAVDPSGGTIVAGVTHLPGFMYAIGYYRFDKAGQAEASQQVASGGPLEHNDVVRVAAAGIALSGHALVLWAAPNGCRMRWLDRDGTPLTAVLDAPSCEQAALFPLLDGSLALQSRDSRNDLIVSARMLDGQPGWTSPPQFLRDNPHVDEEGIALLPGGKGYALRDRSAREELRLFDRAGNPCGTLVLPDLSPGTFSVGRDGTLLVQSYASSGCLFRWWPQIFR